MGFLFRKRQRVKFLKNLFSFYAVIIALTFLALDLWHAYANISTVSILPAVCLLALIWTAYHTSKGHTRSLLRLTAFSYSIFCNDAQQEVLVRIETAGQYICLFGAPLLFPFIFFFSTAVKITVSLSLLFLPHLFVFVAGIVADVRYFKKQKSEKKKRETELSTQQKREELGKWK